jgi:membrane dipeptidase
MTFILDAHLDISWNAMAYDRDQLRSIAELRASEAGMKGYCRGNCTVSLPQMRRANVGICLATLLCRARPPSVTGGQGDLGEMGDRTRGEIILREDLDFANQTIACATAQGQLAYYRLLEQQGHMRMIRDAATLDELAAAWQQGDQADHPPIGYILSMEGADPILNPEHAQWWFDQGLRTVCLAHYGQSFYAMGTGGDGPLSKAGRELLKQFDRLGIILDLVHTANTALAEALDLYAGPVFVSHGNCRSIVPHDRQLSDDQIRAIAARGGVIGVVLDNWMVLPDQKHDSSTKVDVPLARVVDHIDHICQVTGNSDHVGIGSDLDGGFGNEMTPNEIDTIADMQEFGPILSSRNYTDAQINAIFHGNFLRFFREALPQ